MRIRQTEEPSWFWRRRLTAEHNLFIIRRKLYSTEWAYGKARSRYRPFARVPVLPLRDPLRWKGTR